MKTKLIVYLYSIIRRIKLKLGYSVQIDSKQVRRIMYSFYCINEMESIPTYITKVEVYESKKGLSILIETHRADYIIGKGRQLINGLQNRLKSDLKRNDIIIYLKGSKLWTKLYI